MNLNDREIEIILFSINVLKRYKYDLLPKDKIEYISKYLDEAEQCLKTKSKDVFSNIVASMHLSCETVIMINNEEITVDIFTKDKCNSYSNEIIILANKLQNIIDFMNN